VIKEDTLEDENNTNLHLFFKHAKNSIVELENHFLKFKKL